MSLSIKNIQKNFGNKKIFSDFSYTFPETGLYAITGESGIGKTTLLRLIAGIDKKYRGEISDGGIGNVSFAFQEYRLFDELTALENVIYANYDQMDIQNTEEAKKMLSTLGFRELDMALRPSELSGGMKQRVSLARAFLKKSPILLLDEPTKELDSNNINCVLNVILKEGEKRLVILVTHRITDIEMLGAKIINIK